MSDDNSVDVAVPELPKFCKNCANVSIPYSGDTNKYRCFAEQNHAGYDLVTGDKLYLYVTCYQARCEDIADNCTPQGKWFTLAPPKPAYTAPAQSVAQSKAAMDLTVDPTQLAASQDAAKERMRLLLASRKSPAKAATNLLESL